MAGQKRGREGQEGRPEGRHTMPRFSRVDEETATYFSEIAKHLATLDGEEDRQLLADNVLGEAAGKEALVASDAACSRVLEGLLPSASTDALIAFLGACIEGENMGQLCTSGPFGSHVLEKLLGCLAARAASADAGGYAAIEASLAAVTDAAAAHLYDMVTSKYGSFVARRLLTVLCGREVAPAAGKKPGGAGPGEAAAAAAPTPTGPRPVSVGGLAAKLGTGDGSAPGEGPPPADYPELVEKLVGVVVGEDWEDEVAALQGDQHAGPFLQALLRAAQSCDGALLERLTLRVLGCPGGAATLEPDRIRALMMDRGGSHLMEVVFETAPDDLFQKLVTLGFKGHLLPLAQHPAANFGVQAALGALRKPAQLKRMFEDLRPHLGALLRGRRGGVPAALLAAAGRLASGEADVAAAVWHAAGTAPGGAAGGTPLIALLTLDTMTTLGPGATGGRLSSLGCALLVAAFRLPAGACRQYGDALCALPAGDLVAVARDPGGCRVIEAYLEGAGAAPKRRKALLATLDGRWAEIAAGAASGGRFVEKCYAAAEAAAKEAITRDLAGAEARLGGVRWGPTLLVKCHVDAYKRGSADWQQRLAAGDAARREFQDLFGEDGGEGEQQEQEQEAGAGEEEEEEEEPRKKKEKKKGKKRGKEAAASEEAAEGGGDGAGGGGGSPNKKKKKKKKGTAAG